MVATVRKLTRLSAIYALGDILAKGVAFLLLPLYTRFLSPEDFGIIAVVEVTRQVLIMLLSFGMMGAILRFYYQFDDAELRRRFFGTMWTFLILVPGIVVALLLSYGQPLFDGLFRQIPFEPYFSLTLWAAWLHIAFAILPLMLFRAREQATRYIAFSLTTFAATTVLIIYFVVFQQQGAAGYIRAQCFATLLIAVIGMLILLQELRPDLRWKQLGPAIAYSVPLIPHFLSHWGLNAADRAILERYVSLGQLGIYALGYQFGLVYQMIITSANNALIPMFSRASTDGNEFRLLSRIATYYVLAVAFIGLSIALFAGEVIALLLPEAYHSASTVVPWIVLGYFAMALYYFPMNSMAITAGNTKWAPFATTGAAFINIFLNFLFIPRYGIIAAAVTTALGYTCLFVVIFILSQSTLAIAYEYHRINKIILASLLAYAVGMFGMQFNSLINLCAGILTLALFFTFLHWLRFWTSEEQKHMTAWKHRIIAQPDVAQ